MDEMPEDEIIPFLENEVTCRLGLAVDGIPYIVPLSYVYMDGAIYIHLVGGHGKKADWIEKNPHVCLEIDSYTSDHLVRRSVIINGDAERVTERKTLVEFLARLGQKYPHFSPGGIGKHPGVARPFLKASAPFMADKITVYRIEPDSLTARRSDDRQKKE